MAWEGRLVDDCDRSSFILPEPSNLALEADAAWVEEETLLLTCQVHPAFIQSFVFFFGLGLGV